MLFELLTIITVFWPFEKLVSIMLLALTGVGMASWIASWLLPPVAYMSIVAVCGRALSIRHPTIAAQVQQRIMPNIEKVQAKIDPFLANRPVWRNYISHASNFMLDLTTKGAQLLLYRVHPQSEAPVIVNNLKPE